MNTRSVNRFNCISTQTDFRLFMNTHSVNRFNCISTQTGLSEQGPELWNYSFWRSFACAVMFMIGVNVWWVYLVPQNIPSATVLTLGNKVVL